jgi:hypothetical protein
VRELEQSAEVTLDAVVLQKDIDLVQDQNPTASHTHSDGASEHVPACKPSYCKTYMVLELFNLRLVLRSIASKASLLLENALFVRACASEQKSFDESVRAIALTWQRIGSLSP